MLTTSGQRLEDFDIRDFVDVVYAYGIAYGAAESHFRGREFFTEYIYDLKPDAEKMANPIMSGRMGSLTDQRLQQSVEGSILIALPLGSPPIAGHVPGR